MVGLKDKSTYFCRIKFYENKTSPEKIADGNPIGFFLPECFVHSLQFGKAVFGSLIFFCYKFYFTD
jgi:hypothetical protein